MTGIVALRSASSYNRIRGEVHMVTHLNLVLGDRRWHIRKLLHHTLVSHHL